MDSGVTVPKIAPKIALAGLLALAVLAWRVTQRDALVVYCAHDAVYSARILKDFERRTGTRIAIRFDTEATKSLGLVELIKREKAAPRCDVFWNNETLGTLDLQQEGLLEPYQGSGFARIPAAFKDAQGYWTGFAARLRVSIANTQRLGATPDAAAVEALFAAPDLSAVAIAKPLYGTTLTHFSVLWQHWGGDRVKAWHADMRRRGLRELQGNAATKDAVANGACVVGWTDTDDYFAAKDEGRPVAMLPIRIEGDTTICIPNSVAIIRGTKRGDAARKLVDFLLSSETELALARSKSRQIPLGPVPESELPAEVRELKHWAADGVALDAKTLAARNECLAWLKGGAAQ
jgi:iron(III) transport system substrate-binding protein